MFNNLESMSLEGLKELRRSIKRELTRFSGAKFSAATNAAHKNAIQRERDSNAKALRQTEELLAKIDALIKNKKIL